MHGGTLNRVMWPELAPLEPAGASTDQRFDPGQMLSAAVARSPQHPCVGPKCRVGADLFVNVPAMADAEDENDEAVLSRRLNRMRLDEPKRKQWARHGSTGWLWEPQHVSVAIRYVVMFASPEL